MGFENSPRKVIQKYKVVSVSHVLTEQGRVWDVVVIPPSGWLEGWIGPKPPMCFRGKGGIWYRYEPTEPEFRKKMYGDGGRGPVLDAIASEYAFQHF